MGKGVSKDTIRNPLQIGPRITREETAHRWAGRTTLNSGSASVTVSTALVNSDSIIMWGTQATSVSAVVNSGGVATLVVNSIVSGTSFAFARATASAIPSDVTIMWELIRTSG